MKNLDSSFVCCWWEQQFLQWCWPLLSCDTSFGYTVKPSLNSLLCLASRLNHHCNLNGIKCCYVVTRELFLLEHNLQEMCSWKWCIIVEMYSMIVGYALIIVDYIFTFVDYDLTLVYYILTLIKYKLIIIENIFSFSRI